MLSKHQQLIWNACPYPSQPHVNCCSHSQMRKESLFLSLLFVSLSPTQALAWPVAWKKNRFTVRWILHVTKASNSRDTETVFSRVSNALKRWPQHHKYKFSLVLQLQIIIVLFLQDLSIVRKEQHAKKNFPEVRTLRLLWNFSKINKNNTDCEVPATSNQQCVWSGLAVVMCVCVCRFSARAYVRACMRAWHKKDANC